MQAFLEIQQNGKIDKQVINTKYILFIASGAFTGLEDIVKKRVSSSSIGFGSSSLEHVSEDGSNDYISNIETKDFIDYGFEPEFIGRLPVKVACTPLSEKHLYEILKKSEGSLIHQYMHSFKSYGIDVEFKDAALKEFASQAFVEKTGARAFLTIFEKTFRDFKFELPSAEVNHLVVDQELLSCPKKYLAKILEHAAKDNLSEMNLIREFEKEFKDKHHMHVEFDQGACKLICKETNHSSWTSVKDYCWHLLQSYEHGLKLIQQNTGKDKFVLGNSVVQNPKLELEKMVKDSYCSSHI